jgi:hypothetical protein
LSSEESGVAGTSWSDAPADLSIESVSEVREGRRTDRVRILVLSVQPEQHLLLRTDEEGYRIREALRRASRRQQFEVVLFSAARVEDLSRALLEYDPDILHFTGHLLFEQSDGSASAMTGEPLARLFRIFKGGRLRCVVLNAAQSGLEAEPIAREVGAVVVRSHPDQAALVFAEHFYSGLAYGRTLQEAFNLGCWQVEAHGWRGEAGSLQLLGEAREIRFAS